MKLMEDLANDVLNMFVPVGVCVSCVYIIHNNIHTIL